MDTDHGGNNQGPDPSLNRTIPASQNYSATSSVSPQQQQHQMVVSTAARTLPVIPTGLVIIKRQKDPRKHRRPHHHHHHHHHARRPIRSLRELMDESYVNQVSMRSPPSPPRASSMAHGSPIARQRIVDLCLTGPLCGSCKIVHADVLRTPRQSSSQAVVAHFGPNYARRPNRHRLRTRSENYDDASGSHLARIISELPLSTGDWDVQASNAISPSTTTTTTSSTNNTSTTTDTTEDENARCYYITTYKHRPGITITKVTVPNQAEQEQPRTHLRRVGQEVAALMGQPSRNLRNITVSELDSVSRSIQNMRVDD